MADALQDEISYDPDDYTIDAHPHPTWKRLRDERPVYYNERFDFYALSRFADVKQASLDHRGAIRCGDHTGEAVLHVLTQRVVRCELGDLGASGAAVGVPLWGRGPKLQIATTGGRVAA